MSAAATPVGLIGAGELGSLVLRALTKAGRPVLCFDPSPAAADVIAAAGARSATAVAEVATACEQVLIAVATLDQARTVLLGDDGVYAHLGQGTVILHSTIDPVSSRDLAAQAPDGIRYIDAPVTFRRTTAPPPTLLAFVGADGPLPEETRALLDAYCHELVECGPAGAGQAAKLVNNVMSLVNTAVATEALRLAESLGIDPERMRALAMHGSGASNAINTWAQRRTLFVPGPGDDRRRALARKDLLAAIEMGRAGGIELPLTALAVTQVP